PLLDLRFVVPHAARDADVLPERSVVSLRPDVSVGPRRACAGPARFEVRPEPHRTGVGARLPLRHRGAGTGVDALRGADVSADRRLVAVPSQTVGPYLHLGLDTEPKLRQMCGPDTRGERIRLRVRVIDGAGEPLPDALVELWQADASGTYVEAPDHASSDPGAAFRGWGRPATGRPGWRDVETVRPGDP